MSGDLLTTRWTIEDTEKLPLNIATEDEFNYCVCELGDKPKSQAHPELIAVAEHIVKLHNDSLMNSNNVYDENIGVVND